MRAAGLAVVLMVAAAGGCSLVLGFDKDYHQLEGGDGVGGSGGGGSGSGGVIDTGDVEGSVNKIYLLPGGGTSTVGLDLSQGTTIQALSPKPGGGFTVIDGEGHADGTFTIHGVPPGPYYLRRNSEYWWFTGRHPRFDYEYFQRADAKLVTQMTPVTVSLTGLSPWDLQHDYAALVSLSAGANYGFNSPLNAGDTALSETFDWAAVSGPNILVPSDSIYFTQSTHQSANGFEYTAVTRFAGVSSLTMEDGKPLQIGAALKSTQKTLTLGWDLPALESYAKLVSPHTQSVSHDFIVFDQPTLEHGLVTTDLSLLDFTPPPGTGKIFSLPLTYASTGLEDGALAWTLFDVPFQLPGSTSAASVVGEISRSDTKDAFAQGITGVSLSPPGTPELDGRSLFLDQSPASTTPTITWTAPAKGHVDMYYARIRRLYKNASGATRVESGNIARLLTDGTSLAIPPDILVPGEAYVIIITAVSAPGLDYQNAPYTFGVKEVDAEVVSGMLSIPPANAMCPQGACVVGNDCSPPSNDCLESTCYMGCCGTANKSIGAVCKTNGGKVCDGDGACVACLINADCKSPNICGADYKCGPQPSCQGLPATCGNNEGCCASPLVTGGTYNRSNDPGSPATVSDFRLDRFEGTVGRFRAFVTAWVAGWRPDAGAGKHRHVPMGGLNMGDGSPTLEPGWDVTWSAKLASDKATWDTNLDCAPPLPTWTPSAGANESLPMNCLDWYEAYAFCIWDGGFLPSEAEWNYAAAAGSQQRQYPWGFQSPDPGLAVFDCTGDGSMAGLCSFADILKAGSRSPGGDGWYGQADLAGSMAEWNLDCAYGYPHDCTDCAPTSLPCTNRDLRGGSWSQQEQGVSSSWRNNSDPLTRTPDLGVRCARTP